MSIASGTKIFAADYNAMQSKVANVLGTGSGDKGYGQAVASGQVSVGDTITAVQMQNLKTDLNKIAFHQNNAATSAPSIVANSRIDASDWAVYDSQATSLESSRFNLSTSQSTKIVNLQPTFTTWNGLQTHNVTVDFGSATSGRYFFNAGGEIILEPSHSGDTLAKGASWKALLASFIPVRIKSSTTTAQAGTGSAIGWYGLSTSNQTVFTIAATGTYAGNSYTVKARCDVADNSAGTARYLYLTIELNDSGANPGSDLNVDGTTTNTVSNLRATGSYVSVSAPTVSDNYVAPGATYSLSANPATQSNEGATVTFTLTTTNLASGTSVPYTISGTNINTNDFGGSSLTGSFVINASGVGTVSYTIANDATTEGNETFTLALNNGQASINYTIVDSSQTPAPTYSVTPAATTVNEGSSVTFNVSGSNITNGTYYWYVNNNGTSSADFSATNGSFTITGNSGSFSVIATADLLTESSPETFTVSISSTSLGTALATSTQAVTIADTSTTPAATYAWNLYPTSVNEGSNYTYSVTTTNVPDGTTLYWAISNATTSDADFSAANGSFTITSNAGSFTVSPIADATTEGSQTFQVTLRSGSISGSLLIPSLNSPTITIDDTSQTPATDVSGTLTDPSDSTNVLNGINIISGAATISDIQANTIFTLDSTRTGYEFSLNGSTGWATSISITSNSSGIITFYMRMASSGNYSTAKSFGSFNLIFTRPAGGTDSLSYTSNWTVTTRAYDSIADPFSFTSVTNQEPLTTVTSNTITVTGLTSGATYTITASNGLVDTGVTSLSGTFASSKTVTTTASGTFVMAAKVGTATFGNTATVTITVQGNTSGTFSATTRIADAVGSLTTPTLGTNSELNTPTVSFGATFSELEPNFTFTLSAASGLVSTNDSTGFASSISITTNGSGNATVYYKLTASGSYNTAVSMGQLTLSGGGASQTYNPGWSVTTKQPAPTYSVTPAASNVNEGSSLTFNVSGTNIVNGTYYWTITNSGDFGTSSGSFTITSNSGSFSVTPTADLTTEGSETFTASIRSDSISGTVLETSSSVTINDTSSTPVGNSGLITTDQTFTVPAGVYSIKMLCVGAGGSGGGGTARVQNTGPYTGGGGGGGGALSWGTLSVTPGSQLNCYIGVGGTSPGRRDGGYSGAVYGVNGGGTSILGFNGQSYGVVLYGGGGYGGCSSINSGDATAASDGSGGGLNYTATIGRGGGSVSTGATLYATSPYTNQDQWGGGYGASGWNINTTVGADPIWTAGGQGLGGIGNAFCYLNTLDGYSFYGANARTYTYRAAATGSGYGGGGGGGGRDNEYWGDTGQDGAAGTNGCAFIWWGY
jgi:hypothetical protein